MKALLLVFTFLKLGKVLTTGGTMLLSVGAYAFVFGWQHAAGFVLLIVHEMGHYVAAKRCGLDVGAPTFIPFVGAWIQLKDLPHGAKTEAYVGLAGPLVGSVGALLCFYLARNYDSDPLLALSMPGSSSICSTSFRSRHSTAVASSPSCATTCTKSSRSGVERRTTAPDCGLGAADALL